MPVPKQLSNSIVHLSSWCFQLEVIKSLPNGVMEIRFQPQLRRCHTVHDLLGLPMIVGIMV